MPGNRPELTLPLSLVARLRLEASACGVSETEIIISALRSYFAQLQGEGGTAHHPAERPARPPRR